MLILTEWHGEGLLNLIQVFFPSSSVCKAFFSPKADIKVSCQKLFGRGCAREWRKKKGYERKPLLSHSLLLHSEPENSTQQSDCWKFKKKEKPKTKKHSVFQCIAVSAVKNKLKLNISVQCCAMSCDLIQQCLNSEQLRELNEGNTHTLISIFPSKLLTFHPSCDTPGARTRPG